MLYKLRESLLYFNNFECVQNIKAIYEQMVKICYTVKDIYAV